MKDKVNYIPSADFMNGDPERWEQFAMRVAHRAQQITEQATKLFHIVGTPKGNEALVLYVQILSNVNELEVMFDFSEEANATDARDTEA